MQQRENEENDREKESKGIECESDGKERGAVSMTPLKRLTAPPTSLSISLL